MKKFWDLAYSMVVIVMNTVLCTWKLLRVDLKCSHHTHRNDNCEVMEVLAYTIVVIILQYMSVSNHDIVHTILCANYISIKEGKLIKCMLSWSKKICTIQETLIINNSLTFWSHFPPAFLKDNEQNTFWKIDGIEKNQICCCCCQVASVMSNSVRPHRRQLARLPCPWDSPGKNTGVGCHFLLQCMKVKGESEVVQSCPTLSDPMDCSLPGSSVHGIFQARVLEWGAIAFSESN